MRSTKGPIDVSSILDQSPSRIMGTKYNDVYTSTDDMDAEDDDDDDTGSAIGSDVTDDTEDDDDASDDAFDDVLADVYVAADDDTNN